MASLSFDGVGKTYGENVIAIANVSFTIADGEFVVLVGPSGCGKSTLLRIAAGLEDLTSGRLLMDEADVTDRGPEDRDIAMVFQNYALYPHMSVYENMAFGLRQRKVAKPEIDRLVREVAEMLDLSRYLERKPGALSGGQRQRVAMGRAIVRHPACFLMDEPLSNLDAKLRVQMRSELKLLNQRLGVTTLYVTHDQVEAMTMGDRVAVLQPINHAGQSNLQQIDTPQTLYDRPVNMFVAGFIGSPAMNFLRADLTREGDAIVAHVAGTRQRIATPPFQALEPYVGQRVVLGIRPEAFEVCGEDQAIFHEPVPVAEALGADTFVFFDIDSPPVGISNIGEEASLTAKGRSRLVARIPPARAPRANERLPLSVDPQKLHWFDPATGAAIRD